MRPFILGVTVVVYTDHSALREVLGAPGRELSGKFARWAILFAEYCPRIVHVPREKNKLADVLSHLPDQTNDVAWDEPEPEPAFQTFERETEPLLHDIARYLATLDTSLPQKVKRAARRFLLIRGVLFREGSRGMRRVLGRGELAKLLPQFHDAVGHYGARATFDAVSERFWWPGPMYAHVREYVATCIPCREFGPLPRRSELSGPTPVETTGLFQRFSIDFVGPLPETPRGNRFIIVAIEHLASWPIARAAQAIDAEALVSFLLSDIVSVFGCPIQVLSDKGPAFVSLLYAEVLRLLGVQKDVTSSYRPQTNGKVERFNQTLVRSLEKMADHNEWDRHLDICLFGYRVRRGRNGFSPFQLLYGHEPRLAPDVVEGQGRPPPIPSTLLRKVELDAAVLPRLVLPEVRFVPKGPRFKAGDRVWCLRIAAMRAKASGKVPKFTRVFAGPYIIVRCQLPKLYRLQDADGRFSRNLVHEDRLVLARSRAAFTEAGGAVVPQTAQEASQAVAQAAGPLTLP